jgi:hypothetical protein
VSYALGLVVVIVGYGIWVGTIQTTIENHANADAKMESDIKEITSRQQGADISSAEIKTKLISIEATLVEIKNAVK